jgi:hypothetical protein
MAQMKDSFGTEYYITDFNLKWDLEKPALLKATSIIPSGTVSDTSILETGCGTTNVSIYGAISFNGDLYVCGDSTALGIPGKVYRYVDEQYWEPCYEGEGLAETPKQVILSASGTYLYFICESSSKVYCSSSGTSWSQIGSLTGGDSAHCILGFNYSGTNYIYVGIGTKIFRSTEGSSTWTELTLTGDVIGSVAGKEIYWLASFNGKMWMCNSYSSVIHYSTDGGSYWTYLYSSTFCGLPTFCYAYGSYLYVTNTYYLYPDRNTGRICRIDTSNVVTYVGLCGKGEGQWGKALCTYDSKPFILCADGKIYYSSDGTGGSGTWSMIIDTNSYGFGKGLCMSKESGSTYLWFGTDDYRICKISGSAGSYTVTEVAILNNPSYAVMKNVLCLWVGSTSFAGGGTTYVNDGFMSKSNGAPDTYISNPFYGYYGYPERYIYDIAVFGGYIYIVTGSHGFVLRSADGNDWNIVYDTTATNLYAIGVTTGYIWVAGDGSAVWRSSNGTTWSTVGSMTYTVMCMTKSSSSATVYAGTTYTSNTLWTCTDSTSTWVSQGIAVGATIYAIIITPSGPSNISVAFTSGNGWFGYKISSTWYYNTPHGSTVGRALTYYNGKWYIGFEDGRIYNSTSHSTLTWVHEMTISTPDTAVRCLYPFGIDMYVGGYLSTGGASIYKYVNSILTREVDHGIEEFDEISNFIVFNNYIYGGGETNNGSIIIRSADGIRWEKVWENDTAGRDIGALAVWGNYLYMSESCAGAAKVYRSVSGMDWTLMWTSSFDSINDLKYWNSYLYAACSYSSSGTAAAVYRSSDGSSWGSCASTGDTTKHIIYTLCIHGSYLFFGGGGSLSSKLIIGRTSNGTSWSYTHSGITSTYSAIAKLVSFGSYIYACGYWASDLKPVWRSTSGGTSTWSQVTGLISYTSLSAICFDMWATSDKLYAILNYSELFESTNGTSWTLLHSMSNNSSIYVVGVLFDNVITAGTRIFYRPISDLGKYIQKLKFAEYFEFYSCSNNETEKFILKDLEIDRNKNDTVMDMTLQGHVIDLWRTFGYYMEGTNGYVDHSEEGIYADELLENIIDGSCSSRFRVKYCPHTLIKIKGEWLSKTQWLYEIARNLSFSVNDNSTYSSSHLKATEDSSSDTIIDKMNVVIDNNGNIFIMPAGSDIAGTDPDYVGFFEKRITDVTNYVWDASKVSVNMIDYTNAIVLDGSGTGAARKNYLAKPITVSYVNDFTTQAKCDEMSNVVCEPNYSGSVRAFVNTTGAYMNVWGEMLNPNYHIPVYVNVYHPSLVLSTEDTATMMVSVRNDAVLDGATDTSYWKEVGLIFGGGNDAGNFSKMYRVVLKENRANSVYTYYLILYDGTTELESYTLTAGSNIQNLASLNYLVVRWDKSGGVPRIRAWMSMTAMPDPDVDTAKINYSSTELTNDFGTVGLSSSGGFTITSATAYYGKTTPRIQAYYGDFSVTGQSMSLWNSTSITKPVMIVRDKSITAKDEARGVAMNAYQNASTTKQIKIRVDPDQYMWGSTSDRIYLGQWVTISGKGFYDGEYRVKTIELTQTGMWLGLENNRVKFTDYVDAIRQQVNKVDSFG